MTYVIAPARPRVAPVWCVLLRSPEGPIAAYYCGGNHPWTANEAECLGFNDRAEAERHATGMRNLDPRNAALISVEAA
jgi:hypothetical protein